ncbi:MAG TPA: integration host factor, actinobacterial type [Gemmataceae bacterium]|nr:integration host factor, actinobacterial type [Gemmataceae bacterium]
MPLPTLTPAQRQQALEKAAEARRKRAELKAQLKSGNLPLATVLAKRDDTVGSMKVASVLESLPGVGKVRARKIMEKYDISASRRIRGLGSKQKDALLAEFGGRSYSQVPPGTGNPPPPPPGTGNPPPPKLRG